MRCVQVCDKVQGVHIWDLVGTGSRTTVGTAKADSLSQSLCTYCGQCVTHCPVGALEERDDTDHVYRMLARSHPHDRRTGCTCCPRGVDRIFWSLTRTGCAGRSGLRAAGAGI